MELPEEVDFNFAILDVAQNSALDHIRDCGPQIIGQLVLTVYLNEAGEPSCCTSIDGNSYAIIGATEMWLLNEKTVK